MFDSPPHRFFVPVNTTLPTREYRSDVVRSPYVEPGSFTVTGFDVVTTIVSIDCVMRSSVSQECTV